MARTQFGPFAFTCGHGLCAFIKKNPASQDMQKTFTLTNTFSVCADTWFMFLFLALYVKLGGQHSGSQTLIVQTAP